MVIEVVHSIPCEEKGPMVEMSFKYHESPLRFATTKATAEPAHSSVDEKLRKLCIAMAQFPNDGDGQTIKRCKNGICICPLMSIVRKCREY